MIAKQVCEWLLVKAVNVSCLAIGAGLIGVLADGIPPADAQSMPSTLKMTCKEAANLVAKKGGVVLRTGENTFDRYVLDLADCSMGDALRPEWVPTRDVKQCFIGYTCYVPDYDRWPD